MTGVGDGDGGMHLLRQFSSPGSTELSTHPSNSGQSIANETQFFVT
jgi:hypothetical protein